MKRKLIAILVAIMMLSSLGLVACKDNKIDLDKIINKDAPEIVYPDYDGADTLVVGYDDFSNKFSSFFAKTSYDQDVASMTQVSLLTTDRQGNIIYNAIEGEKTTYNGTEYTYNGVANIDVNISADKKTTTYSIKLREDLFFSDGTHMTIDDLIFSYYVYADPTYVGSSSFSSLPIKGLEAYRTNGIDKSDDAEAFMTVAKSASTKLAEEQELTADEQAAYDWWMANVQDTSAWNWVFDYSVDFLKSTYGLPEDATEADVYESIAADEFLGFFDDYAGDLISIKALQLATEEAEQTGAVVKSISGIVKTGSYSMTVKTDGFDVTTIYQLGVEIAPLHYYGSRELYKYTENKFGFDKGNLSSVEANTTKPMGAGPYKFVKFENGTVYFERNGYYFQGCPNITNVLFKETTETDKLPGVVAGTYDIAEPSFAKSVADAIKSENSNNQISGDKITTNTVDFLGYGYIGINAKNVKVGSDFNSEASKNLRRAFATMFAAYREEAVDSYYADAASVINYPISNTSWAAPQATDDGYKIAYSTDVDGNPIYTANMNAAQKYPLALDAAKEYLISAGYTFNEATGKFTAAPTGAKLNYEMIIPAQGTTSHPSFSLVTNVSNALENIGITLLINNPNDSNVLWNTLEAGNGEMWCAAWGATIDPDMYQVYHSNNVVGKPGSTESNHYSIEDAQLDELIMAARASADKAYRKNVYKQALDIIMDWAVEIPVYQRQEATIFSTTRIDVSSITSDITTFWGWAKEVETLKMH